MKISVYYYTRSGNTKKLADAVANAVGVTAEDIKTPLSEKCDIVFLGSSPYAFDVDPAVKAFIEKNRENIGTLVCFGTSASGMTTFKKIKALSEKIGVKVDSEYYNCYGHFMALHKDRPNENDLKEVSTFAKSVAAKLTKQA